MQKEKLESIFVIAGISIGIAIILYIFASTGFDNITKVLFSLNPLYFLLALAAELGYLSMQGLRIYQFVGLFEKVRFREMFMSKNVGFAIDNITPIARGGGEVAEGFIIDKVTNIGIDKSFACVIASMLFEWISFLFLCLIAVTLIFLFFPVPLIVIIILAFFLGLVIFSIYIVSVVFTDTHRANAMLRRFFNRLSFIRKIRENKEKWLKIVEKHVGIFVKAIKEDIHKEGAKVSITSFFIRLFEILRIFFIILALGGEINILALVVIVALVDIVGFFPTTPGALGVSDAALVGLLTIVGGLPLSIASSVIIVERLLNYVLRSIIGFSSAGILEVEIKHLRKKKMHHIIE